MGARVRVLVVDDHALFRQGLISLLREMPDVEVVGEAADGAQALQLMRSLSPDVVLLDVNMPGMDGVEVVERARQQGVTSRIVMLTISREEEDLWGALHAGADGYLLKNVEPHDLHRALLAVAQGQSILAPEVTRPVLQAARHQRSGDTTTVLTRRERDVLRALAQGMTTAQIAQALFITENTVKTHVRHLLRKLEARNRIEAVTKALQQGLLRPDEVGEKRGPADR